MTEVGAYDLKRSSLGILRLGELGYDELCFESMALLFARVIAFLSFFGRSIGDSEASIRHNPECSPVPQAVTPEVRIDREHEGLV